MNDVGRRSLPRITLDTNVVVSALISRGTSRQVLELARSGPLTLILSPFILEETADVLRAKMGWDEGRIQAALEMIKGFSTLVHPQKRLSVVKEDAQDNRIVECAASGRADYLVSGDKHILSLNEYKGTRFLSPRDLLEALRNK
jgi:putative PIN family toxin of toxin-antitoxin system